MGSSFGLFSWAHKGCCCTLGSTREAHIKGKLSTCQIQDHQHIMKLCTCTNIMQILLYIHLRSLCKVFVNLVQWAVNQIFGNKAIVSVKRHCLFFSFKLNVCSNKHLKGQFTCTPHMLPYVILCVLGLFWLCLAAFFMRMALNLNCGMRTSFMQSLVVVKHETKFVLDT